MTVIISPAVPASRCRRVPEALAKEDVPQDTDEAVAFVVFTFDAWV